jgi:hypothetical protein
VGLKKIFILKILSAEKILKNFHTNKKEKELHIHQILDIR